MINKKPYNLRLAVLLAICLCLGIVCSYYFCVKNVLGLAITLSVFVIFLATFFIFNLKVCGKITVVIFSAVFILSFFVGGVNFNARVENYENADLGNYYLTITGRIDNIGDTDNGSSILLDNVSVKGIKNGKLAYKVMTYTDKKSDFRIGDIIVYSANLKDKNLYYGNTFAKYDLANKVKYYANVNVDDIELLSHSPTIFQKCKLFMQDTLKEGLDEKEYTVAYAMLTGDSELMDYNTLTSYRYTGVAHIFAVSGLHIGFLSTALGFLLKKLRVKGVAKALIIIICLIFYSGICGFTASSLRATIMCAVMLLLSMRGERYDAFSSIAISAIIILLISPEQLFCLGFQLSYCIVLGIILLSKPIAKIIKKGIKFLPYKVCSVLGLAFSAQLAGAPILMQSFGYYSPISILMNLVLIPIVSVLFIFLIIMTLVGGAIGIAKICLFVPNYVLKFINLLITSIDSESLLIPGIIMGGFLVFYYGALIISSGLINIKIKTKIVSVVIALAVFVGGTIGLNVDNSKYTKVIVSGSNTSSMAVISSGGQNVLIVANATRTYSLSDLRRIKDVYRISELSAVILQEGFEYDMQIFVSRLKEVFALDTIIYYGEKDSTMELIMAISFPNIDVVNVIENQAMPIKDLTAFYVAEGCAVQVVACGKRIVSISKTTDKTIDYSEVQSQMDLLIAGHSAGVFEVEFNPEEIVTFTATDGFNDGQSNGEYLYQFK